MQYIIECRFKSLTQPQEWSNVACDGTTFNKDEVQRFKSDLGPDDWDHGMEYRVRVHPDYLVAGMEEITPLHPPRDHQESPRRPARMGFLAEILSRSFASGGQRV